MEAGSKTKGAVAGAGVVAALGGVAARSADDFALAGCRATRATSVAGESVTPIARNAPGLADDGLRGFGAPAIAHADDGFAHGRPWMVAGAEENGALAGSSVDDTVARGVGAPAVRRTHGSSPVETALDLSLDVADLASGLGEPSADNDPADRLVLSAWITNPHGLVVQSWPDESDGAAGVPLPDNVLRVTGEDLADYGITAALRRIPGADPLVVFGRSDDHGRTLAVGHRRIRVDALHAECASAGRQCVSMICNAEPVEPSPCMTSLPEVFAAARVAGHRTTHLRFVTLLAKERATWDATMGVRIGYMKEEGTGQPALVRIGPLGADNRRAPYDSE